MSNTSAIPQNVLAPINPSVAVTGATTSAAIPVEGVRKASIFYTRTAGTAGDSTLTVTTSVDGTNYIATNLLISNAVNTIAQGLTRVASLNLSTNVTKFVSLDLDAMTVKYIKVVSTNNSDADDGVVKVNLVLEYY